MRQASQPPPAALWDAGAPPRRSWRSRGAGGAARRGAAGALKLAQGAHCGRRTSVAGSGDVGELSPWKLLVANVTRCSLEGPALTAACATKPWSCGRAKQSGGACPVSGVREYRRAGAQPQRREAVAPRQAHPAAGRRAEARPAARRRAASRRAAVARCSNRSAHLLSLGAVVAAGDAQQLLRAAAARQRLQTRVPRRRRVRLQLQTFGKLARRYRRHSQRRGRQQRAQLAVVQGGRPARQPRLHARHGVATGLSQHSPPLFPSAANARRAAPAPPVGVRRPATAPARPQEAPLQCRVRQPAAVVHNTTRFGLSSIGTSTAREKAHVL